MRCLDDHVEGNTKDEDESVTQPMQHADGESDEKKRDHLPTREPETWVVDASVGSTYSVGSGLAGTVGGSLSRRRSRSP